MVLSAKRLCHKFEEGFLAGQFDLKDCISLLYPYFILN